MFELLAIGCGGFIGAILRYLAGSWIQRSFGQSGFPIGTLMVNLIGCLVIGLLGGLNETREIFSPQVRSMIFLGILGSFTTFSTFGYETLALLRDGQFLAACISTSLHLIVGLAAVWTGYTIATMTH